MGIKFNCPNGHKLNVKSFLAGRRGICPECDARFRIPMESGGVAELVQKGDRGGEETQLTGAMQDEAADAMGGYLGAASFGQDFGSPLGTIVNSSPWTANTNADPMSPASGARTASPMGIYPTAASDPLSEDPQAVWYVRPRSGGQYGPAVAEILRDWIREGRVAGDSYVWREGWADWRSASSVFPQLAGLLTAGAPTAMVAPVGASMPMAGSLAAGGGLAMGNVAAAGSYPMAGAVGGAGGAALGALPASGIAAIEASASAPHSLPSSKRIDARRRNSNLTAMIVVVLLLIAVVLVGVFAWVLFHKPATPPAPVSAVIIAPADLPLSRL